MDKSPSVAYLIESRFPGGTSAAVARELAVMREVARVTIHDYPSRMFQGREMSRISAGPWKR